jgi:oligopeptidase A
MYLWLVRQSLQGDQACYADVLEALERIEDPLEFAWGAVSHLTGVLNSDALRAAHQQAMPLVVAASTKVSQSAAVFAALQAVEAQAQRAAAAAADFAALPAVAGGGVQECGAGSAASAGSRGFLLDEAQGRVVAQALRGMTLSGVGLAGADKDSFNANRVKLSELSTTFSNNVLDATKVS